MNKQEEENHAETDENLENQSSSINNSSTEVSRQDKTTKLQVHGGKVESYQTTIQWYCQC